MGKTTINLQELKDHTWRKELMASVNEFIQETTDIVMDIDLSQLTYGNEKVFSRNDMLKLQVKLLKRMREEPENLIQKIRAENAIGYEKDPIGTHDGNNTTDSE